MQNKNFPGRKLIETWPFTSLRAGGGCSAYKSAIINTLQVLVSLYFSLLKPLFEITWYNKNIFLQY